MQHGNRLVVIIHIQAWEMLHKLKIKEILDTSEN